MSDCILWERGRSMGYGEITRQREDGAWIPIRAHRAAYEEANGPIPSKMHVHHACQNKLCVNPEHLELISPSDHARLHRKFKPPCTICGKPQNARGLCSTHYRRWWRWGDPHLIKQGGRGPQLMEWRS